MVSKTDFFKDIRNGNLEGVQAVLKHNPDWVNSTDERGSTPLLLTTYYGHLEIAKYLLERIYGHPHKTFTSYRREINQWPQIKLEMERASENPIMFSLSVKVYQQL